jgi:hypothetical protein
MRNFLLAILSLNILICSGQEIHKDYSNKNPVVNDNNIFRSKENNYRIQIPINWSVNKGNSLGAEFNAKSEIGDASLNIIVATLTSPPKFTAHDIPSETLMQTIKKNNPSSILLESEKQYLSNEKALYIKYRFNYKTLDTDTDIICIQYSIIKESKIYTVTLQAQEWTYSSYKNIFRETLKSFMLEAY